MRLRSVVEGWLRGVPVEVTEGESGGAARPGWSMWECQVWHVGHGTGSVWAVVAARETATYWMECLDFIGKRRSLEKSTRQKDVILLHKVLFPSVHTSKYYTIWTREPHLQSSLYTSFLKLVEGWRLLWNVGLGCRILSKTPWLTFCQQQPCSSVTLCVSRFPPGADSLGSRVFLSLSSGTFSFLEL